MARLYADEQNHVLSMSYIFTMNGQKLKRKIIFINVPKYHQAMRSVFEDALAYFAGFENFELIVIDANYTNLANGHLLYKIQQEINPKKFVHIIYIQGWHYINGVQFLKDLRENSLIQTIPIVISSADDDIEEFLNKQWVVFVSVPICLYEWARTINMAFKLAILASKAQHN
ncbi:MAG: hypothetical protein RIM23_13095 [Coleofasciculus sp. G3-WIS-01]|uniref:hypothetical protein n=1 Tax=Coleofasciculus sp. G3-WIS-01 TaxID=3069528 RepID=UPI0032F96BBA